jgi:L,D-peptidoglycan transpeptidase YkuD (ErfK/YbiS/YcfS/YnhG family)
VKRIIAALVAAAAIPLLPAPASAATVRCFHTAAPYQSYVPAGACAAGRAQVSLPAGTTQVVTVTNWIKARAFAHLNAWQLEGSSWVHVFGPWTARIGGGGWASPGQKIEGDDLTPQGTYGFQFMFGVNPNPGVHFAWRHAFRYDYWDDDPASARYNLWTNTRTRNAGANPEPMHNVPAYNYAAVIGYNLARVPGAGSAIFLHVGDGQATAGCVSLPQAELLQVITWLRPAANPVITMERL